MKLSLKQYRQEGDLGWEYNPLHNIIETEGPDEGAIVDFDVDSTTFNVDLHHPLNIECQPSYDGTVNLIINDDKNPPRIINSRFTKIEDNKYRVINRNQKEQTNLYARDRVDQQTRLFRTLDKLPKFDLYNISYFGQLKGGNYTFYLKYADNDYNQTDIVAETGMISIFKGSLSNIKTISGTLADERTDKSIKLKLSNIDTSFTKAYLYYSRETSDLNGVRATVFEKILKPYDIVDEEMIITVNGFEDVEAVDENTLNIKYNVVDAVKTQAQIQNRLFFANVDEPIPNDKELQNISYYIKVAVTQDITKDNKIGFVNTEYKNKGSVTNANEYYSPQNIYYRLGYWPDEMYRMGIVYIMNNDTLTPVYNLRGIDFNKVEGSVNYSDTDDYHEYSTKDEYNVERVNYVPKIDFLNDSTLSNTMGVFRTPTNWTIFDDKETKPIYFKMTILPELIEALKANKIKGFFFVRQKRIPTSLGQGLEVGVNSNCYVPMLALPEEDTAKMRYVSESFKTTNSLLTTNLYSRLLYKNGNDKQSSGLLSLDAICNPYLQSLFDGTEFVLYESHKTKAVRSIRNFKYNWRETSETDPKASKLGLTSRLNYVPTNCPAKVIEDKVYSTRQGSEYSVSEFGWWDEPGRSVYISKNPNIVRGVYTGFLASNLKLAPGSVYTIKINKYNVAFLKDYFQIRGDDNAPFMAVSGRYSLYDDVEYDTNEEGLKTPKEFDLDVYRGDCYVNTITIRFNRNFNDPDVPIDDYIIDDQTWSKNYKGYYGAIYVNGKDATDRQTTAIERIADSLTDPNNKEPDNVTKFYKINRADVNAVPLGMWVTFKCLSNYNLGLRSIDRQNVEEMALIGNPRAFYPFAGISTKSAFKLSDSELLNDGYSSTVGHRINFKYQDVPYIKDQFDNRIMFSNVQVDDQFKNSYRIFQGLSYQDIDRQYGAIVKIYPWYASGSGNILCVFEHGIGIVPVNQKALLQTTTGQEIHMYGAGVLSSDITVLSDDFGSTWEDSIIKTPLAIYGVDTYAKKIWKMPLGGGGIECISDMKVQQFLNDNITFKESDKTPIIALRNVKTHYNNYKGDVMFTFYDYERNKEWNLCYNERLNLWVTRYSWTPLASENINNSYYSFDKKRAEILAYVADNRTCEWGLRTDKNMLSDLESGIKLTLAGYEKWDADFNIDLSASKIRYKVKDQFVEKSAENILNYQNNLLTCSDIPKDEEGKLFDWYLIDLVVKPYADIINDDKDDVHEFTEFVYTIGIINNMESTRNAFYVHGRSNIYDELNYEDESFENHILPTKWYDKQEPFEFEFVVTQPVGLHKIFDNLVIISNNVEPKSFEFEIVGDVYNFNKAGLYWTEDRCTDDPKVKDGHEFDLKYNPEKHSIVEGEDITYQTSQVFDNVEVTWDHTLNTYGLKLHQDSKNVINPQYGRRLGNIHYKEDSWHLTIDPILYKTKYKLNDVIKTSDEINSTRLRDKYCKIRVKYTGEDLAIITSLKTMVTMSYA